MTFYEFELDGIIVEDLHSNAEEPVSWDGEEFILSRSADYFGFENSYSTSLRFWGISSDIIKLKYSQFGIEARLPFIVRISCDQKKTWKTIVNGILNCANYSYQNGEVSILLEESDFNRTFKNRIDNNVSMDSILSLDGFPISDINVKSVLLKSKAIVQRSLLFADPNNLAYGTGQQELGNDLVLYFPMDFTLQDLPIPHFIYPYYEVCDDTSGAFDCPKQPIFTNNFGFAISIKITIRIKGSLEISVFSIEDKGVYIASSVLRLQWGPNNQVLGEEIPGTPGCIQSPSGTDNEVARTKNFDYFLEQYITVGAGENVFLHYDIETERPFPGGPHNCGNPDTEGGGWAAWQATMVLDKESYVDMLGVTITPDTDANVFLVHEALAKISEVITGQKDCFKSDFFGSGNSQPRQYDKTGCQRYVAVTNGINIRNMKQNDGTKYPINLSFSQLYKMLDSIFCLGMRLEYDESEKHWFVRVEPREYFFDRDDFMTLDNVSDITVRANLDNYFSSFKIGYKQWQLNNGQTNGLDEFNTNRSYTILNKNANKELDASCDAWAGGYPIEFTRRQQFEANTTLDFETDNDIFIVCLNRVPVTRNGKTYQPGTTNETNELFDSVANLISPETAYNLRISPTRNAQRWARYLKCSLYKNETQKIKFSSGEGNYQLSTQYKTGWCEAECTMEEKADFDIDHNCFDRVALIAPETIEFEIPCDFFTFMDILANANKSIRVNCSNDVIYKGFISMVNFKPNQAEGGTAKFTLITTPVNGGAAFDHGFDVGFDIVV